VLTPEGTDWLASLIAEHLKGAWIIISDGKGESYPAPITSIEVQGEGGEDRVVLATAEVGENEANFEWAKRSVKLTDGTVLDADESDGGRKVQGAVWTAEVAFDL
jgi:hypothetical protein